MSMNSAIKDIALDYIVENITSPAWVFTDDELELFGKTIVMRCQELIAKRLFANPCDENQIAHNNALHCAILDITEHFWNE